MRKWLSAIAVASLLCSALVCLSFTIGGMFDVAAS
jgi:hypothetical protein